MHSSPNCYALSRCALPIAIFASPLLGVSSRCCLAPSLLGNASLPAAASRCCRSRFPARSIFPMALRIGTSAGSCFPMLPQRLPLEHLPRSSFRTAATRGAVTSSAQTSASLHPPAALRLRVLPFTMGMDAHGLCGRVPDSAGNISPRIASAQTDANLSAHLHRLLTPPPYLLLMRLSPGRERRCCVQDEAAAWPGGQVLRAG